ncbi:hypothetical protein DQ04_05071030 [Trypanosoma grayi]|uniref:hypothetical protein n=1 Tax=Trypanosoma grayi TaxID=71804 RepID=UPI0004F43405|nr:hypothetical protein DQ04_05071030 [Trypanosoma grayi]KEG09532.1 hypothetical protein DQ04_05071030 [Trypanosoma grayi]
MPGLPTSSEMQSCPQLYSAGLLLTPSASLSTSSSWALLDFCSSDTQPHELTAGHLSPEYDVVSTPALRSFLPAASSPDDAQSESTTPASEEDPATAPPTGHPDECGTTSGAAGERLDVPSSELGGKQRRMESGECGDPHPAPKKDEQYSLRCRNASNVRIPERARRCGRSRCGRHRRRQKKKPSGRS